MQILNPRVIEALKDYFGTEGRTVSYLTKHVKVEGVSARQVKYHRKRMVDEGILVPLVGGTSDAIYAVNAEHESTN